MRKFYQDIEENGSMFEQRDGDYEAYDIVEIFGKDNLETIQEKLSKATGLAFITVDYKGEPIIKYESFTRFCKEVRKNPIALSCCKASDAFGAIQAAVTKKPSIYFCPCGLMDIAIPIIVKGHYLGGFIGGQIRCEDAPCEVGQLENVIKQETDYRNKDNFCDYFNEVPVYAYEKVADIANLVSLIINQLTENEMERGMESKGMKSEISALTIQNQKYALDNRMLANELANLRSRLNPYFLINSITSISNLAIIDEADRTHEMLILFAEYIKKSLMNTKNSVYLSDELDNIERYLQMQKIKFCGTLEYSILIPRKMQMQKIPCHILMPFVESAIFYGIATRREGGMIEINGVYDNDDVVIEIRDNGSGFSEDEITEIYGNYKGGFEGDSIDAGIKNAKQRIRVLFGDKYDVVIENKFKQGRTCIIRYPKNYEERVN